VSAPGVLQSALDPAGPQAGHISSLFWLMLAITGIVSLLVLGAIAIAIVRGRRTSSGAEAPIGPFGERAVEPGLMRAVGASVFLTVVTLFVILAASFWTQRATASLGAASALTINVTGHQFWWEIEYDDAVPARRVQTANEIHVPLNRPVVLKVTSRDVIHSFWAPNLHGKRDLIPGYTTAVWLQADRPAVYRGQCAEFCGKQHAHMAFEIVAEPDAQFEQWLDAQRAPSVVPQTEDARSGRDVFMSTQCVLCHSIRGTSAQGLVGPNLTHVASRGKIAAGTLPNTADRLSLWITHPQDVKPGSQMPPTRLTDDQRAALVSYLEILK
jgi:cytochrome c oxidase subunit II